VVAIAEPATETHSTSSCTCARERAFLGPPPFMGPEKYWTTQGRLVQGSWGTRRHVCDVWTWHCIGLGIGMERSSVGSKDWASLKRSTMRGRRQSSMLAHKQYESTVEYQVLEQEWKEFTTFFLRGLSRGLDALQESSCLQIMYKTSFSLVRANLAYLGKCYVGLQLLLPIPTALEWP
jgi:hypothetical protein